jgi:phospholipase/carboxylesterase
MGAAQNAVIIEPVKTHRTSIIWLHGLGADGNDFVPIVPELHLPDRLGIRFVFPHAPVRPVTINGGMSMRAWYDVRNMDLRREEDAESIEESAGIIEQYIAAETAAGIPSGQIVLAGFSQGGAMALHTGLRYPSKLGGVLALSAYLPLPERFLNEAADANKTTPVMMCHGTYDQVIPASAGKQSCEFLKQAGYAVNWHSYPMQHSVCLEEVEEIGNWLQMILG